MDVDEATVFSVLFAWGRVVLVKSFLNYCAASSSRASFSWTIFLVYTCWCFQIVSFLCSKSGLYKSKQANKQTKHREITTT